MPYVVKKDDRPRKDRSGPAQYFPRAEHRGRRSRRQRQRWPSELQWWPGRRPGGDDRHINVFPPDERFRRQLLTEPNIDAALAALRMTPLDDIRSTADYRDDVARRILLAELLAL